MTITQLFIYLGVIASLFPFGAFSDLLFLSKKQYYNLRSPPKKIQYVLCLFRRYVNPLSFGYFNKLVCG